MNMEAKAGKRVMNSIRLQFDLTPEELATVVANLYGVLGKSSTGYNKTTTAFVMALDNAQHHGESK